MTTHPLVSIFMPCYNQENFIADAIQTCIDQNYENFEIIIVDDHSTDSTWEIVKSIYNQYPRLLRISRNPRNLGITPTCNQILKKCRGKYICFTAGDEIYLPDKISKQVELMECSSMMALSYHDVEVFDSATNEGLVVFTSTDQLGDFRIGAGLTIRRQAGTIEGETFERSLYAILTPYILALEG